MNILLTMTAVFFLTSTVFAETIHLKNGRTVSGKVLQKDDKSLKDGKKSKDGKGVSTSSSSSTS